MRVKPKIMSPLTLTCLKDMKEVATEDVHKGGRDAVGAQNGCPVMDFHTS